MFEHNRKFVPYEEADTDRKLMICLRELEHMLHERHEDRGQRRILVMLSESESTTQRDLTERLGIRPGSASEILAKLERAGLIARTPNEFDRRTVDIRLTDEGRALAEQSKEHRRQRGDMFASLSEEEKASLLALLEKVCGERLSQLGEMPPRGEHGRRGRRGHGGPHGREGRYGHGDGRFREGGRHEHRGEHDADDGEDA